MRRIGLLRLYFPTPGTRFARPESTAIRLDDFGHRHAQPVVDDHDFAARHQPVVDIDVDRLADLAIELDDGAAAELQQLAHLHGRAAEHRRDLHGNVINCTELARTGATGFFRT